MFTFSIISNYSLKIEKQERKLNIYNCLMKEGRPSIRRTPDFDTYRGLREERGFEERAIHNGTNV